MHSKSVAEKTHLPGYGGSHTITLCGRKFRRFSYFVPDVNCKVCLAIRANEKALEGVKHGQTK